MESADVILEGGPLKLDAESQLILENDASKDTKKNIEILKQISEKQSSKKRKQSIFFFLRLRLK